MKRKQEKKWLAGSKWTAVLLVLTFILGTAGLPGAAAADVNVDANANDGFPGVSARSAVVLDATTGRFLYEKNPDEQMRIASTTKIMTAIVAIENANPEDIVKIGREHMAEGSSMYLKAGEEVKVIDLLYGLMLMSGNDAARALAYHCAGSIEGFADMMNSKADDIGMNGSSFRNPNGLDEQGHYSTARDMAVLAKYAMQNETFRTIAGTKKGYFAGRYMTNHNRLLFRIQGATGIKTGYTDASGRCLVSAVSREGREVIIVTLNASSDWNDHSVLYNKAFGEYKPYTAAEEGHVMAYIPVISGDVPSVGVYIPEACRMWISDSEKPETVLYLPKFIYAPAAQGGVAGEIAFLINGKEVKRLPLLYDAEVLAVEQKLGFFERIVKFMKNIVR